MANYEELSPILNNIICEKMLRSQELCKLLHYYPKTSDSDLELFPDLSYSVYNNPDIQDTSLLYMRSIYPLPKMPDAKTEQKMYVCATLSGGYDADVNLGFRRINLYVDIICHLNAWVVKEGFRPYLVMNIIDSFLNNKLTDLPIQNKPISRGFQARDYSHYFYGLQMVYEFMVNSNVECVPTPQNIDLNTEEPDVPIVKGNMFLPKNLGLKKGL